MVHLLRRLYGVDAPDIWYSEEGTVPSVTVHLSTANVPFTVALRFLCAQLKETAVYVMN